MYGSINNTVQNELDILYGVNSVLDSNDFTAQAIIHRASNISSSADLELIKSHLWSAVEIIIAKDLHSEAEIKKAVFNQLDVTYHINAIAEALNFSGHAIIVRHRDMPSAAELDLVKKQLISSAIINLCSTVRSEAYIAKVEFNQLDIFYHINTIAEKLHYISQAIITYPTDLRSLVSINENLTLDVALEILQAPKHTLVIEALQDAYTRQYRPYSNFGYLLSLAVGNVAEGSFYSYIDFDLTDIIDLEGQAIWSIDLSITRSGTSDGVIYVYENYSNWSEGFIMWVTPMEISEEPLFSFNSNAQIIDITELVLQKIREGKRKLQIVLKSNDFVTFNSKESGYGPKLVVTHSELDWRGHLGYGSLGANATIMTGSRKLFHNTVTIPKKQDRWSHAVLREKGLKESEATIVSPLLHGSANILAHWNMMGASAMIMQTSDLVASFDKNASESHNTAILLTKNLFNSFAHISSGQVNDWREHTAYIRATGNSLKSEAIIPFNEFMASEAIILERSLIVGQSHIANPNFLSVADLRQRSNFYSEANISVPFYEGINSEALIKYYGDELSTAIIRSSQNIDFINEGLIRNLADSGIPAESYIKYYTDTINEAIIRQNNNQDLIGNVIVSIRDFILKQSEAYLHKADWTAGEAYLIAAYDVLSRAGIRIPKEEFHKALAEIYRVSDTNAEAVIHRITQLMGEAIIRESDVRLFYATAFLNGWWPDDITAYADILGRGKSVTSLAVIRTNANVWIPPQVDGKLPRLWKWEDYFPTA